MSNTKLPKHRIFIVGGKGKNIPAWISAAFKWEQFHQDNSKTRDLEPSNRPDAIIVLSSWVGHEHFYGARNLSEKLNIPLIISPGGWSTSLKAASSLGVEWFIQDIERAKYSNDLTTELVDELENFIDNAWREAYTRELVAKEAIVRRYSKDRKKFEKSQQMLKELTKKDEAGQRVISEIRVAASNQRRSLEKERVKANQIVIDVQQKNDLIIEALLRHIDSIQELSKAANVIIDAGCKLKNANRIAGDSIDAVKQIILLREEIEKS